MGAKLKGGIVPPFNFQTEKNSVSVCLKRILAVCRTEVSSFRSLEGMIPTPTRGERILRPSHFQGSMFPEFFTERLNKMTGKDPRSLFVQVKAAVGIGISLERTGGKRNQDRNTRR